MTFMKFLAAAGLVAGNNWLCRVGSSSFPPSAGGESQTATGTSSQGGLGEHVQTRSKACGGEKGILCRMAHFQGMLQHTCMQSQRLYCSSTENPAVKYIQEQHGQKMKEFDLFVQSSPHLLCLCKWF